MDALDWIIISLYLGAMLAISARLGRRQHDLSDYYLGGRKLAWSAVGVSVLATQSSAISFISIPAFVATRPDGGLRFLQYEIALPVAMAFLGLWLIPALRRARVFTIYEYLEQRFDRRVRRAVAALFLLGRGLATGVALYATGLVLSACIEMPLYVNLLIIGVVTVAYDLLGGMTAVVYSDVVQMVVLSISVLVCTWLLADAAGGGQAVLASFPPERWAAFAEPADGGDSLWSYVIGGLFLYVSYYGCDQSQAQRLLATASVRDSQRALLLNGFARFPLVLGYCALGVAAASALAKSEPIRGALAGAPADQLVPELVRRLLPSGLRGFVFAGLLAAAMSSLDSALNALSVSSLRDMARQPGSARSQTLVRARVSTLAWGAAITAFAFVVGDISDTVIEAINKVGSAVYGPVLAVFMLALGRRRPASAAVLAGLATGFALNVALWLSAPGLHFLWWNPLGCLVSMAVAWVVHFGARHRMSRVQAAQESHVGQSQHWLPEVTLVGASALALAGILLTMCFLHARAMPLFP